MIHVLTASLWTQHPNPRKGLFRGFMVGGRALGVVLISGIIGLLIERTSWQIGFYSLAILTLIPLPFVLFVKEPPRPVERQFEWKAFKTFNNRSIISLGILGALYSLIINAANQIVNPFLQHQFNITISTAGFVTTVWGLGVILGGISGGKLTDKIGQKNAVLWATGISFFSIIALSLINTQALIWGMVFLFGICIWIL